jgi:hypothetical protein
MRTALCLAVVLAAAAPARAGLASSSDLKQFGLAYFNYLGTFNQAPGKPADLAPFLDNNKQLLGLLTREDVIFFWNVKPTQMPDGASNTVLAYEKDVPDKGGWVLMGDGSVRKMTPNDFKTVKLAGKPKKKK